MDTQQYSIIDFSLIGSQCNFIQPNTILQFYILIVNVEFFSLVLSVEFSSLMRWICIFGWSSVNILAVYVYIYGVICISYEEKLFTVWVLECILEVFFLRNKRLLLQVCMAAWPLLCSLLASKWWWELRWAFFLSSCVKLLLVSSLCRPYKDFVLLLCSCVVSF